MKPLEAIIPPETDAPPFLEIPYFIAQQSGWFINTPTLWGVSQTKTFQKPPVMQELKPRYHLSGKRLPLFILLQAKEFFKRIWEKQQTEVCVLITYNPVKDRFAIFVPEQYVSKVGVNFMIEPGQPGHGYHSVGTIHSHCDLSAFHSGTDQHDMGKMPGLHLTIGHVDRPLDEMEVVYGLSVGDVRFDTEYADIIDESKPLSHAGYKSAPEFWDRFVHAGTAPWTGGTSYTTRQSNVRPLQPYQPSQPYFQRSWLDDDDIPLPRYTPPTPSKWEQERKAAFEQYADFTQAVENALDTTRIALALNGFVLQYQLYWNEQQADKIINKTTATQIEEADEMWGEWMTLSSEQGDS